MVHPYISVGTADAANLLDGIVSAGLGQMRRAKASPKAMPILRGIQQGTVRYVRRDPREHWQTWSELNQQLARTGKAGGDCEDLASAVAAELLYAGEKARTYVYQSGPKLYHVVVHTDRWGLLDPSRAAGMGGNG